MSRTVAIVTMGCARNEVDSEELAGRLAADGWTLVEDVESAEVAVVIPAVLSNRRRRIQSMRCLKQILSKATELPVP